MHGPESGPKAADTIVTWQKQCNTDYCDSKVKTLPVSVQDLAQVCLSIVLKLKGLQTLTL